MMNKNTLEVVNPSSAEVLAQLDTDDCSSALGKIKAAKELFRDRSRQLKRHERTAILEKLAAAIELDHEAFAITIPVGITTHRAELQRGLVPEDKAKRVTNFTEQVVYGIGMIAHSCGVSQPRKLERKHVRIIESGGHSVSLAESHPIPAVNTEYINVTKL